MNVRLRHVLWSKLLLESNGQSKSWVCISTNRERRTELNIEYRTRTPGLYYWLCPPVFATKAMGLYSTNRDRRTELNIEYRTRTSSLYYQPNRPARVGSCKCTGIVQAAAAVAKTAGSNYKFRERWKVHYEEPNRAGTRGTPGHKAG